MSKTISVNISTSDAEFEFFVPIYSTGGQLFDQVARTINIREVWFFGLSFNDSKGYSTWLKHNERITSQDVGKQNPLNFQFRVKYYPEEVENELIQTSTQWMFFLEVRKDIIDGRVYCSPETAVLLASYSCQVKYGDFREEMLDTMLDADKLLPDSVVDQHELSPETWLEKIVEVHKNHQNMMREEAVLEYLKLAQDLEMFGISYFNIKNKKGSDLLVGIDPLGINVFTTDNALTPNLGFPWSEIKNVSYTNKKFTIRSSDKMNFTFTTEHSRINDTILLLSMGNHDLYLRRRKPESIEMQHIRNLAAEERQVQQVYKDKITREQMAREDIERKLLDMERQLKQSNEVNEGTQRQMAEYESKIAELEALLALSKKQKEELEEMHMRLEESSRELEDAKNTASEDYERLLRENEEIKNEIVTKNVEVEEGARALKERQNELEILRQEREGLEAKAAKGEEEALAQEKSQEDGVMAAMDFEDDRREERRVTSVCLNPAVQNQMMTLAADLHDKRVESKMRPADHIHVENQKKGKDKFQTLKQIRQGNTKKRIDSFEAL